MAFLRSIFLATPLVLTLLALYGARPASACTSILVTPEASSDGSTMITYSADAVFLYGELEFFPAAVHPPGTMRRIYEGDTGDFLGEIPEARETYSVVGYMNEHQVTIGETTFGGRPELVDPTGTLDYVTMMHLALQRAKTAREAIDVLVELVAEHGYRSRGESFSIGDPKEAWILEMIGGGPGSGRALWVARRVPPGYISAHANHARIGRFPLNDPENTRYHPDLIDFAREQGYFSGPDSEFHFAEAYAPLDFGKLRACEARVWSVFRRAAPSQPWPEDYVIGVEGAEPLPLFIRPDSKLSVADVMALMRDHYEDSPLDPRFDLAAGPYNSPYRLRPLYWELDGVRYVHERPISTQQTGFSFVSQSRARFPGPVGGVFWFGVDDSFFTVYVPFYAGVRSIPKAFAEGTASLTRFSWDSAFWLFNLVANYAYPRYSLVKDDILRAQRELEGHFLAKQDEVDRAALELYKQSPELARDYLTNLAHEKTAETMTRWRSLLKELWVKYLDGNVKDEHGRVTSPGYSEEFRRKIVAERGDFLKYKHLPTAPSPDTEITPAGFFHNRDELGERAERVPEDFPFETEKLFLVSGDGVCPRPPACCLTPEPDEDGARLLLRRPPAPADDPCGQPDWLIRIPKTEQRPIVEPAN